MTVQSKALSDETGTKITAQREAMLKRGSGIMRWQVSEFDDGRAYILTADPGSGLGVNFYLDAIQWGEFQKLIAGDQTCRVCEGAGMVSSPGFRGPAPSIECWDCDGTGVEPR